MKLPSLQSLFIGFKNVVQRFPLQFLSSIISVVFWWLLIDNDYKQVYQEYQFCKVLYVCNFALTLLLAADLFAETRLLSATKKWLLRALMLAICIALYYSLNPFQYNSDIYRVFILALAFHLLVAFAPFLGRGSINGFWQYNKSLFLRILTAGLYAGVLFAGLAIALVAIDGLFSVKIDYKIYLKLLSLIGSGFTTVFFLSGLPTNFKVLDDDNNYPKGLKIFTQYVLIPLMSVYLAILLVYEVKILIEWHLPKGLVSTLILGYSVFGILSLLLVYPIRHKEGNGWIRLFSKFFHLMMIPLIVLLILAIIKRVGSYGITESRYILMLLAFWLTAITIYFLFSSKQNIKVIPISLAILALLASYGPQSAFSVSEQSQISRLARLMKSKDKKDLEERPSVIRYLVKNHGLQSLQKFTPINLKVIEEKIDPKNTKKLNDRWQMEALKVDTAFSILKVKETGGHYENFKAVQYYNFENANKGIVFTKGYDFLYQLKSYSQNNQLIIIDGQEINIRYRSGYANKTNDQLFIAIAKNKPMVFDLTNLAKNMMIRYGNREDVNGKVIVAAQDIQLIGSQGGYTFKMELVSLNGNFYNGTFNNLNFDGFLMIKKGAH